MAVMRTESGSPVSPVWDPEMYTEHPMYKGSCLCGAVRFEVRSALPAPDACHCSKCRKWSGHFWVSTEVPRADLTIHGADQLTWFRSSEKVQRGFCSTCGSSLFY